MYVQLVAWEVWGPGRSVLFFFVFLRFAPKKAYSVVPFVNSLKAAIGLFLLVAVLLAFSQIPQASRLQQEVPKDPQGHEAAAAARCRSAQRPRGVGCQEVPQIV